MWTIIVLLLLFLLVRASRKRKTKIGQEARETVYDDEPKPYVTPTGIRENRTPMPISERLSEYTVIDTETTGLYSKDKLIEVSAATIRQGRIVDTFTRLVNPGIPISPEASAVNNITDDMVCDCPMFAEISREFIDFIGDDIIVGYNIGFDLGFIQRELGRQLENSVVDAYNFAKDTIYLQSYKLTDVAAFFNVGCAGCHRAGEDVRITQQVFEKLMDANSCAIHDAKYYAPYFPPPMHLKDFTVNTQVPDNPLKGKRVAFIGEFSDKKRLISSFCELGGKPQFTPSKTTAFAVIGKNVFQEQMNRIVDAGTKMVNEKEFTDMLDQAKEPKLLQFAANNRS